jgi:hypothetical protein
MKKTKIRLLASIIFGIIGMLIYALILWHKGFEVNEYNLFVVAMLPGIFTKIFLINAAFFFFSTTLFIVVKEGLSKFLCYQIIFALIVVLIVGVPEYIKIKRTNLFNSTNKENLNSETIYSLYLKALDQDDVDALANLSKQRNISDSLENVLSESKHFEVRRAVGWNSKSKIILARLSNDLNYEVRMAVASNMLTPLKIVNRLQNDTNEIVKNTAFSMFQARKSRE